DRIRARQVAVFTAPDNPRPLVDLGTVDSTLVVPTLAGNPVVQQIQVALDISHTFDSDLRITLYGPDPDGPGPLQPKSVVLSAGNPPFTGLFRPEQPLAAFIGTQLAGAWTLRVEDLFTLDTGTLNGWSISFLDASGNPITVNQAGTSMDQDADARVGEIGTNFNPNVPADQQQPQLYTDSFNAPGTVGKN